MAGGNRPHYRSQWRRLLTDQLFSSAALSADQYGRRGGRYLSSLLHGKRFSRSAGSVHRLH
jgi:hypothetical protein